MKFPVCDETKSYTQAKLESPEIYGFLQGCLALFTTPAPDRTGPNEDAAAVLPINQDTGVIIIADGLGGMANGDIASSITVRTVTESIQKGIKEQLSIRECILNGIELANQSVNDLASSSASTIAVIEIQGKTIRPYHVGDPLILVTGQRGKIKFQNITHSPMGYAVESGLMNEEEAIQHEERSLVSNVIGLSDMRIEIGPVIELDPRDALIIASDGLSDNLYIHEITEIIRKGRIDRSARQIVSGVQQRMQHPEADKPSHIDDLTFIMYRPTC